MLIVDIEFVRNTKKSNDEKRRFLRCCVDSIEEIKEKAKVIDEKKRNR